MGNTSFTGLQEMFESPAPQQKEAEEREAAEPGTPGLSTSALYEEVIFIYVRLFKKKKKAFFIIDIK